MKTKNSYESDGAHMKTYEFDAIINIILEN